MQVSDFSTWGYEVLAHYDLKKPALTFIRHNENITFRVIDALSGKKYLLRLHKPITENFASAQQRPVELASELLWLEALHRDTALIVQQPVKNRAGEFVTLFYPEPDVGMSCTLLHWIEGEPLQQNVTADLVEDLGTVVAQLHEHVIAWSIPAGFVRPTYDSEFFTGQARLLLPGIEAGLLTAREYAIIQSLVAATGELLASTEAGRDNWGLIHADLHRGNCLMYQDRIRPIDFSLCGFGHFLLDFGSSLPSFRGELRQSFITGYLKRRKLPEDYLRVVEAFCILCRMCSYVFMLPKVSERERLRTRIAHFVANECQQFLRNEPVLLAM